ncbi:MAG: hypothetical protein Q8M94_09440, partial [Ignavibacteria bacterium]|nr:hypothetical protein [Ignavibacteria bacterium]
MKYIITLVLIVLFFSGQILAQEKNKVIQSPYESLIKKLNDFYHLNKADGNNYDEKELFAFDSRNNKLFQILKNLEDKFNSAGESIDKNTRTISSERMLGEGFLQVESISQSWDGTNWVNSSRSTNVYDAKNNRVQSTYQTWNVSVWENSYRYSYIYDVNNNQTEYAYQSWNGTAWVNSSRYLYTYNVNNDVTRQISQTWNGSAWVDYSQYLYTYDLNNDLTLQLYQTWSGTAWTDYSRRTYTYDSNHNQLEQVSQNWSG